VVGLIEEFGAWGVFLLMVPESACVPVPSEVTLLFSGFAVHQGWMSLPVAILAATAGNLVGSLIAYGVGASRVLVGVPVVSGVLGRWEGLIERQGTRAVFTARLLPLARTFVSLPAGAQGVPLGPFVVLTTIGCALWAAALILTGLLAGAAWTTVDSMLGKVLLGVGLGALAYALFSGPVRRSRAQESRAPEREP
jgi:membrane protein DedA with SNARE-associated domain